MTRVLKRPNHLCLRFHIESNMHLLSFILPNTSSLLMKMKMQVNCYFLSVILQNARVIYCNRVEFVINRTSHPSQHAKTT